VKKKTLITHLEPSEFSKEFSKRLNAKYVIASPQRVDKLFHDLHDPERNRAAAEHLDSQPHTALHALPSGQLQLFDTAVIFRTSDKDYPVGFFYTFKHVMFDRKHAIQEVDLEVLDVAKDVRIDNLPLSAYTLFNVLLPKFKIVVGGIQQTPEGEKWSKRQIKEAITKGFHVYLRNDNGDLYDADTYDVVEMNEGYLWGIEEEYKKRLTIISTDKLP